MKTHTTSRRLATGVSLCLGLALFTGCIYDEPLTQQPTRQIEPRLLGDWKPAGENDALKVRKLDDSTYVLTCGGDLYRAYHSDHAGLPLVSVQSLDNRKYAYLTWKLSDDGKVLTLRMINSKVIPEDLKTTAAVQKALKANAKNPSLFQEECKYDRQQE